MMYVPDRVFTVEGVGRHRDRLASFELALRDAGVEPFNFVGVSSIYPPDAERVSMEEGRDALEAGQVVHAVLSEASTPQNQRVAASVGAARPPEGHGYFVEKNGVADAAPEEGDAGALARELVDELREELEEEFELYVSTEGERDVWTTAVAAVVFVPPAD